MVKSPLESNSQISVDLKSFPEYRKEIIMIVVAHTSRAKENRKGIA